MKDEKLQTHDTESIAEVRKKLIFSDNMLYRTPIIFIGIIVLSGTILQSYR